MKVFITGDTHIPHDIHKLNSRNFPKIDNNEVTIVNICNVTYKSMEEFIANIIPDLHKTYPELLL
jgi:hypothetical protein